MTIKNGSDMMVKPRIPEGGAIIDNEELNMEQYSERMKKMMGFEYRGIVSQTCI